MKIILPCKPFQCSAKNCKENCCTNLLAQNGFGLTVKEWEIPKLDSIAKERSLRINIKGVYGFFEEKYRYYVNLSFRIYHDTCPFLDSDKFCSIYKYRPLQCRSYPIQQSGHLIFENKDQKFAPKIGNCPEVDKRIFIPPPEVMSLKSIEELQGFNEKFLFEYFGDCFKYGLQFDLIQKWTMDTLKDLENKNKIKITQKEGNPYEVGYPVVGFFKFLVLTGLKTKREYDQIISRFNNCIDAEKIIQ